MLSEISPLNQARLELLEHSARARDNDILAAAQADFDRQNQLDAATTYRGLLGTEALALAERMSWLHSHPRLSRLIGRSALRLTQNRDGSINTPLILSTETETVGDADVEEGFIIDTKLYESFYKSFGPLAQLGIERTVRDKMTETSHVAERYDIQTSYTPSGRLNVDMPRKLSAYRFEARKEILKNLEKMYPWLSEYYFGGSGDVYLEISKYGISLDDLGFRAMLMDDETEKALNLEVTIITDEVLPRLTIGRDWDYPDELFQFPLGLVMQAHDTIGRRK